MHVSALRQPDCLQKGTPFTTISIEVEEIFLQCSAEQASRAAACRRCFRGCRPGSLRAGNQLDVLVGAVWHRFKHLGLGEGVYCYGCGVSTRVSQEYARVSLAESACGGLKEHVLSVADHEGGVAYLEQCQWRRLGTVHYAPTRTRPTLTSAQCAKHERALPQGKITPEKCVESFTSRYLAFSSILFFACQRWHVSTVVPG